MFDSYLNESMMKRAQARKLVDIRVRDLRDFSVVKKEALRQAQGNRSPRRTVDDRPYGGGPGMVLKIKPIIKAIASLRLKPKDTKAKIVLFSAAGKQFSQKMAGDWAKKYDRIVMIAGHYEGVDDRIKKIIKDSTGVSVEEISIGPYTLTGGELPALVVIDAVSRHIPGFLGKAESLEETRYGVGLPAYTRPEVFAYKNKKYKVPSVLLTGDHKKIEEWRINHGK